MCLRFGWFNNWGLSRINCNRRCGSQEIWFSKISTNIVFMEVVSKIIIEAFAFSLHRMTSLKQLDFMLDNIHSKALFE